MVAHFVSLLFLGFIIYTSNPGSSLFSWHPTLMSLSCGFLTTQSIMIFNSRSSLLLGCSPSTRIMLHRFVGIISVILAWIGFFVIYQNKNINNLKHFESWHGLVGFITTIFMTIQATGGNFLIYHSLLKITKLTWKKMKMYHATSGFLLYLLITSSLILGMFSKWFTTIVTGTSWYCCLSCPGIMALVIMQQVNENNLPKTKQQTKSK